jgi:hypothetical protein
MLCNTAIILLHEHYTSKRLPFNIFDTNIIDLSCVFNDNSSAYDNLCSVEAYLKKIFSNTTNLSSFFTHEFLYLLTNFSQINYCFNRYKREYKIITNYIKAVRQLFKERTLSILNFPEQYSDLRIPPSIYNNISAPEVCNELLNYQNELKSNLVVVTSLYENLCDFYETNAVSYAFELLAEHNHNSSNEIKSSVADLLNLLDGNNVTRYVVIMDTYKNMDTETIRLFSLVIFNLMKTDWTNYFIFILSSRYTVQQHCFPQNLDTFTLEKKLFDVYNSSISSYSPFEIFTYIDFDSLSLDEWNLYLSLPSIKSLLPSLLQFLYELLGDKAIKDIDDFIFSL